MKQMYSGISFVRIFLGVSVWGGDQTAPLIARNIFYSWNRIRKVGSTNFI